MHEAETGPVSLFGMGARLEDVGHQLGGVGTGLAGPVDETGGGPFQVGAVGGGHVVGVGGVAALSTQPRVGRDPLGLEEDLDGGGGGPDLHRFLQELEGNAVTADVRSPQNAGLRSPPY